MRKAQVSHMFQWIFVLIAGAMFLGFMISFGMKQSKQAETTSNLEISKALETILRTVERSPDTFKRIQTPEATLLLSCDPTGSDYRVLGSPSTGSLEYNIVFAPNRLKGKELLAWTKDWRIPFKIANFLYLTNKKTQYIFVNDTNEQTLSLLKDFPKNFTQRLLEPTTDSFSTFTYQNYDHYRFIYIGQNPGIKLPPPPPIGANVSIVSTEGDNPDGTGILQFYEYKGGPLPTPKESAYLRREAIYAAMFAQDYKNYACNVRKALDRFKISIELAKFWANNVSQQIESPTCRGLLGNIKDELNEMDEELNEMITKVQQPPTPANAEAMAEHAETIRESAENIEGYNNDLTLSSCPQLY